MAKYNINFLIAIFCLLLTSFCFSQATIEFRISSVYSDVNDMDGTFNSSDPQWVYDILDNSFGRFDSGTTHHTNINCIGTETPNDVFFSEIYNCSAPLSYRFRWRGKEDDGALPTSDITNTAGDAVSSIQSINIPASSINLPQTSWTTIGSYTSTAFGDRCPSGSTVTWRITLQYRTFFTSFPGNGNDSICNAVNLGTLTSGNTLGDNNLSNYSNLCAGNTGDPNPWGGDNDQGVWFQFTTGSNPSSVISIDANNDPQSIGDGIDLQLALYESSNNSCTGTLTLIDEDYQGIGTQWDEDMALNCLKPNTTYFLLVDGEAYSLLTNDGLEGRFGLQISDSGIAQAGDLICDAEFLGQVPDGGSVGTPALSRSNNCANNTNDPTPALFSTDQGVWFQFQAPNSGRVSIQANSDQASPIGTDAVDLQLAVYGTDNGTGNCNDSLNHLNSIYTPGNFNETLNLSCLNPGDYYWVLVDGSSLNVDGIFDITISDTNNYDINTWNGTLWSRGTPNIHQQLVISGNYNTSIQGNLEGCNLIIANGGVLDIQAGDYVYVVNDLTVDGDIQVRHEGSFVQENDLGSVVVNASGNVDVHKTTTPMLNWWSYTFWSSPVIDDTVGSALASSHPVRRHVFLPANFNDGNADGADDEGNDWRYALDSETMTPGIGYVACGQTTETYPGFQQNVRFNGAFNNGVITTPISMLATPDPWNIIGNPYASAIDSHLFVSGNAGRVDNTFYLWTHNSAPIVHTGPYVLDFTTDDYATYNTSMATGTAATSGGSIPSRYIASGQSFLIRGASAGNATFNNAMRVKTNNDTFFRTSNTVANKNTTSQRDLLWLNLTNEFGAFNQILVGFVEGASNTVDEYDSKKRLSPSVSFYSVIDGNGYTINGRQTLEGDQEIPLGIISKVSGSFNYSIEIDHTEGNFEDYDIFLEDRELNVLHDLRLDKYDLIIDEGVFNERFALVLMKKDNIEELTVANDSVVIYQNSNDLEIISSVENIKSLSIYDVLGKRVYNKQSINLNSFTTNIHDLNQAMYVARIELDNNQILTKKFIKK